MTQARGTAGELSENDTFRIFFKNIFEISFSEHLISTFFACHVSSHPHDALGSRICVITFISQKRKPKNKEGTVPKTSPVVSEVAGVWTHAPGLILLHPSSVVMPAMLDSQILSVCLRSLPLQGQGPHVLSLKLLVQSQVHSRTWGTVMVVMVVVFSSNSGIFSHYSGSIK